MWLLSPSHIRTCVRHHDLFSTWKREGHKRLFIDIYLNSHSRPALVFNWVDTDEFGSGVGLQIMRDHLSRADISLKYLRKEATKQSKEGNRPHEQQHPIVTTKAPRILISNENSMRMRIVEILKG